MIVRIDKSREDQEPVQVDIRGPRRRAGKSEREIEDTGDAITFDLYRRAPRVPGSYGAPGSANDQLTFLMQMAILDHHWVSHSARELHPWLK
jgi:hypothetical protein